MLHCRESWGLRTSRTRSQGLDTDSHTQAQRYQRPRTPRLRPRDETSEPKTWAQAPSLSIHTLVWPYPLQVGSSSDLLVLELGRHRLVTPESSGRGVTKQVVAGWQASLDMSRFSGVHFCRRGRDPLWGVDMELMHYQLNREVTGISFGSLWIKR